MTIRNPPNWIFTFKPSNDQTFRVVDLRQKACGLGDLLVHVKTATPKTLYVLPAYAQRMAALFTGKAPVIVSDSYPTPATSFWIDEEMRAQVRAELAPSCRIAININCSTRWKDFRETDAQRWQIVADRLRERGFVLTQYGVSANRTPLKNVEQRPNLPLPKLAAEYEYVGRYVGVDTGDMHLAVAVGAKCWVARPPECADYRYSDWEQPGVNYFGFDQFEEMYDSIIRG